MSAVCPSCGVPLLEDGTVDGTTESHLTECRATFLVVGVDNAGDRWESGDRIPDYETARHVLAVNRRIATRPARWSIETEAAS